MNGGTEYWCYDDYRECRGRVVAPSPENHDPKPYIPPEQRSGGTVLTLANANPTEIVSTTTNKSKQHGYRTLVAFGLFGGMAMVAYYYRRGLRSKYYTHSSSVGAAGHAIGEYELGAYENSLTDDF
jgi:hypothetical protein